MKRIIVVLLMSFSFVLNGCSHQADSSSQAISGELHTIGEQTSKSQKIQLTNKTGMTIEAFFVKNNKTNKPSDNLMMDNEFTHRQRRNFFYEFKEGITYDIQIQSDGKSYNLHEIPFDQMKEATLIKEDGLVYLEYINEDGETVSTKEFEENYVPVVKEEKKQTQTQSNKPVFVEEPVEQENLQQEETTTESQSTEITQSTDTQEQVVVNQQPVVETPTTPTETNQ